MLIDLSNVLSEPHRSVDETVPCELKIFRNGLGEYPVTESSNVHVKINYMENGKLQIEGTCKLTVEIPCDRCLEPVATVFELNISRITKGNVTDESEVESEDLDEANYIDGYTLDVDQLISSEILIGWPTKILCSEDCKGICNVCGQNLNQGTVTVKIRVLTLECQLSVMYLRILRRCNLCQFVQRTNLQKLEEIKEELIGR